MSDGHLSNGPREPSARARVRVVTLGCRLNAFESEAIRLHATAAGLRDTVIVNTCAVTAEAVRQSGQIIRKLKRENPAAHLVVTGCAAQIEPQRFADMPEVDRVIGNREKMDAHTYRGFDRGDGPRVRVNDIMSVRETAHALMDGFGSRARLCAGAKRLRPSMHVLHHSLWAWSVPLGARGRSGGERAPSGRRRLP